MILGKAATILTLLLSTILPIHSQTPEAIVQQSVVAYNNRDIESFMNCFSKDVSLYNLNDPKPIAVGIESIRKLYTNLFEQSPQLHTKIMNRICFGNTIIDHEYITGRLGANTPVILVMIYEVDHNQIKKLTAIREK